MRKKTRHQMCSKSGKSKFHDMCDMDDMDDMCDMNDICDMNDMCDTDDDMDDMCDTDDDMEDMVCEKPSQMGCMQDMDKDMCGNFPECILLAHAYVPWQMYEKAFTPSEALMKGTLFPELWGVYRIPK